jgi:hypothetical protein
VPFVGRFTSNRGAFIDRPLAGNAACASLSIMSGPGYTGMGWPWKTPPARTMAVVAAPFGCVAGKGFVTTTGMGAGVGAGFKIAPYAFSKPLPAYPVAVSDRSPGPVLQFATSFRVTGPRPVRARPPAGTMNNDMNTAAFHVFKAGAWMTQTGRVGSKFSWCPPGFAANCTRASLGTHGAVVKYRGGGNAFGGTMALVASSGANTSNVAIGAGGGAVGFALIKGIASEATGRGYADYVLEMWSPGPLWGKYKVGTVTRPIVGKQKLITMVTNLLRKSTVTGREYRWGFPWTTRTVLVRETATHFGNPFILTISAKGHDQVTAMGARNISLVAGGVTYTRFATGNYDSVAIAQMTLPEPGPVPQLVAGMIALLTIAGSRARARR